MRLGWLALTAAIFAGCESLKESPPAAPQANVMAVANEAPAIVPAADVAPDADTSGSRDESQGKARLLPSRVPEPREDVHGPARASPSQATDAPVPDDPLTLAAECLERGDKPAAATHLDAYVRLHPEQIMFRAHLAELLLKLDRLPDSRRHFEQFIAAAQEATGSPRSHVVHCHTRLMEIGQREEDAFAEEFHRGVGLLLLVKELQAAGVSDEGMMEEVLCKALAALKAAEELRPNDPRVQFYLAEAFDRTENRRAADLALVAARKHAFPGALTPQETRRLSMSYRE